MSWTDTPTLAGRHVTLRPLAREDRDGLLAAFADLAHLTVTAVPTDATIDDWFDQRGQELATSRSLPFTVLDADRKIAGATRFMRMNPVHRRVEIGGTIYAPRVQRTGLNTEAKRLLFDHAFDVLDVQCVQIRTNFLNRDSRRAIERLGARFDGVLRGHMVTAAGESRDTACYSILAHEWPDIRRHLDALLQKERR